MTDLREQQRLKALRRYEILDTPTEGTFDRLTRLGAGLFGAPICLISLVDEYRQWFKSRFGLEATETPREVSFCAHAIGHPAEPFVVPDASDDPRFRSNPLVTGPPYLRFYAGAPLISSEGEALGTFCFIDREPRHEPLTPEKTELLQDLALLTVAFMEARLERKLLQETERRLHHAQTALETQLRDRDRRILELESTAGRS